MATKLKDNLTKLMKDRNISLTKLARSTGIAKSSLHGYMNSENTEKVNVSHIKKISEVLKVSMHQLLFSEFDPNEPRSNQTEILKEIFSGDVRVTLHRIEKK